MANVGRVRSTDDAPRAKSTVSKLLGKSTRTQKNPAIVVRGRDNLGFMSGVTGGTDAEATPAPVPCAADGRATEGHDGDRGQEAQQRPLVTNKRTVKCGSCSLENRFAIEDKKRTEKFREIGGGRPNFSRIPEEGPYSGPGRTLVAGVRRRSDFMPGSPIAKCDSTTALEALSETAIYEELDLKCSSSRDLNTASPDRGFGSPADIGSSLAESSLSQHRLSFSSRYLEQRGLYSRPSCGVRIAELRASRKHEAMRTSSPSTTTASSRSSSSASQSCSESVERGAGEGGGEGGGHRSSLDLSVTYVEHFDETASKVYSGSQSSSSPVSCCPLKSSVTSSHSTPFSETQATASTSSAATQTTPTTSNRQSTNAPRLAISRPSPSGRRETEARTAGPAAAAAPPGPSYPVNSRPLQGVRRHSEQKTTRGITGTEPERTISKAFAQEHLPGADSRLRPSSGVLRSFSESDGCSDCDISLASTNTLTDSYGDEFSEDIGNEDLRSSGTTDDGHSMTPDSPSHRPDDQDSNATDPTTFGVRRLQVKGFSGRRLPANQRPPVHRLESPSQSELSVGRKCLASSISCPLQRPANLPSATRKPNSSAGPNIQRIDNFGQSASSKVKAQSVTTLAKSSSSSDLLPTNPQQQQRQEVPGIVQAKRPTATKASNRSSEAVAAAAPRVLQGSKQRIPVLSSARLRATAERRIERSDLHSVAAAAAPDNSSSGRPAPSLTPSTQNFSFARHVQGEEEEEEEACNCDSSPALLCSSSASNSDARVARLMRSVSSPVGSNQLHPMSTGGSTCKTEDVEGRRCSNAEVFLQHQQLSPIAERSLRRRSSSENDPSAMVDGPGGPSRAGDTVRAMPSKAAAAAPLFRRLSSSQRATSLSKISSEKSLSQVAKPESSKIERIHGRRELAPKSPEDQNVLQTTEISKSQANIYEPASVQIRSNGIRSNHSSSCVALNACRGLQKTPPVQPEARLGPGLGTKQRTRVTDSIGPENPAKSKSFAQPNTSAAISEKAKDHQSPAKNKDSKLISDVDSSRTMFQSKLKTPTDYSGASRSEKTVDWKNSDRCSQGSKTPSAAVHRAKEPDAAAGPTVGMTSVFKHLQMKHVKPYSCATNKSFSVADKFAKTRINSKREKERCQSKDDDSKRHDNQDIANTATAMSEEDFIQGITSKQQHQQRRRQQQQRQQFSEATAAAQSYADPHDELENQKFPVTDVLCPGQIRTDESDSCSGTLIGRIRGEAPSGGGGADEEPVVCSASGGDFELKCVSAKSRSSDQGHRETDPLSGNSQVENERLKSLSSAEQRYKCSDDFAASERNQNEAEIAERDSEGVLGGTCHDDTSHDDSFLLSGGDASISETGSFDSSRAADLGRSTEVDLRVALEREERASRVGCWRSLRSDDHQSKEDQVPEPKDLHRQTNEAILIKSSNRNSLVLVEPETALRGDIDKFVVTYESNNVIVLERADSLAKSIEQTGGEATDSSSAAAAAAAVPREIAGKLAENFDGTRSSTDVRAVTSPKWEPGGIPLSESGYDSWKSQSSKSSARFLKLSDTEMHAIFAFAGAQFIKCSEIGDQSVFERCLDSKNLILKNDFNSKNMNVANRNRVDDKHRFTDICNKSPATASAHDSETSMENFGCQMTDTADDEGQNTADYLFSGLLMSENISEEFCPAVDSFTSSCSSFATVNSATLVRTIGDERFELSEEKWGAGDCSPPSSLLLLSPGGDCFDSSSLDLPDAAAFEAWSPMRTANSAAFHSKDYHNQIYKLDFGTGDSGELANDPEETDGLGGAGRRTRPAALPGGARHGVESKPSDGEGGRWQGKGISSRRWASGPLRDDASSEFSQCIQAARVHSNTFPLPIKKTFAEMFTTKEAKNFAETCQIFSRLSQLKQKTERDTFYENVCDALLENMDPDQSDSDATASPTALEFEKSVGHEFPEERISGRISQTSVLCEKVERLLNLSNPDYLLTNDDASLPFGGKFGGETTQDDDVKGNENQNNRDGISDGSPAKQLAHQEKLMTTENSFQTSQAVVNESIDSRINASLCPVSSVKETFSVAQYCIHENSLMLGGDIDSAQNTVQATAKVSNISQVDCSQSQSYKVPEQSSRKFDLKTSLSKQETAKTPDSKTQTPAQSLSANEVTKASSSSGILSRYFPGLLRKSSKDRNSGNQEVFSRAEKSLSLDRSTTVGLPSSRNSAAVVFRDRKLRNSNIEEPRSVKDVIRHFEDQTAAALKESTSTERTKVNDTPAQSHDQKSKKTKFLKKTKS